MDLENAFSKLEGVYPEMVKFRRDLHMFPELGFSEVQTPRKIADYLKNLGLDVREQVGGRGVVGLLNGGQPGKTVALRADFDALPIQDEKTVEYKSRIPGIAHACGHDIHTAALLGTAKVLKEFQHQLHGNIAFIFQFAEEVPPGGAKAMIDDNCLNGVDVIYGAHVASVIPLGTVGIGEGNVTAAADTFEIEICGKGGHGALPHLSIDPIVLGSQLVINLQQIVSRRIDPTKLAVLTVGSFNSGTVANVIPETAKIIGTVRTFDDDVRDLIEKSIGQMTTATVEGAGATAKYVYTRGYPATWNDPHETKRVEKLAKVVVGEKNVLRLPPLMGGEDFSYYLQNVNGNFFFVGSGNEQIGATYPPHHPLFDVDERCMLNIGKLFISIVNDYL